MVVGDAEAGSAERDGNTEMAAADGVDEGLAPVEGDAVAEGERVGEAEPVGDGLDPSDGEADGSGEVEGDREGKVLMAATEGELEGLEPTDGEADLDGLVVAEVVSTGDLEGKTEMMGFDGKTEDEAEGKTDGLPETVAVAAAVDEGDGMVEVDTRGDLDGLLDGKGVASGA